MRAGGLNLVFLAQALRHTGGRPKKFRTWSRTVRTWGIQTRRSRPISVSAINGMSHQIHSRWQQDLLHRVERLPARKTAPWRLPGQVESLPFREFSLHLACWPLTKIPLAQLLYLFSDMPTRVIQKLGVP